MPPYRHSENKTRYRLCLMIRRALPPMTARLLCPGCLWGKQVDDEKMYCAFSARCAKVQRREWR